MTVKGLCKFKEIHAIFGAQFTVNLGLLVYIYSKVTVDSQ